MLEIEQKFAHADFDAIERRLAEWGACLGEEHMEADHYFNAPDRDFARTDEAFRLRRVGEANFLTYKGPKRTGNVKIRTELEIPLRDGDEAAEQFMQLLAHLGYRPVAVVRKHRRMRHLEKDSFALTVCLDEVEELGRFAEVEILAPEEKVDRVRTVLTDTAVALGLTDLEPRSYLHLLLAARGTSGERGCVSAPSASASASSGRLRNPAPRIVTVIPPLRETIADARCRGLTIGLVPTMGALHQGHLSLIEAARAETGFVVVSIFVNPTQFGPNEDLQRYPRPLERDVELCEQAGVDLVFHPEPAVMYPPGYCTFVEVTGLQEVLCGAARPGHFRGVATVVLKLFNLIQPDRAYFGQKDAQQVRIIQQMVRDLSVPVAVRVCPIVREADGLALSSRNQYLEADERRQATILHRALVEARRRIEAGERDVAVVRQAMVERIASAPGTVLDYAAVVDADSLETPVRLVPGCAILLALAVKFGGTRLIDNLPIQVPV